MRKYIVWLGDIFIFTEELSFSKKYGKIIVYIIEFMSRPLPFCCQRNSATGHWFALNTANCSRTAAAKFT